MSDKKSSYPNAEANLPVIPEWPRIRPLTVRGLGVGQSEVTVYLPRLSNAQRSMFTTFVVQWRRIGAPWSSMNANITAQTAVLPSVLTNGPYEFRVYASGPRSQSQPTMSFKSPIRSLGTAIVMCMRTYTLKLLYIQLFEYTI